MADFSTNIPQVNVNVAAKESQMNSLIDAASPSTYFGRQYNASSGLTWGYLGGVVLVDGTPTRTANGTLSLTNNATCYIEVNRSGAVSFNTSAFTAGRTPLYQVTTLSGAVTNWLDLRCNAVPNGRLSLSVAGNTDVTLTAAQAINDILEFTGALTGNINVIVPTAPDRWFVYNNTSGAFTLTVKTSGGTGVTVPQGVRNIVYSDNTNVVQAGVSVSSANPSASSGLTAVNGTAKTYMTSDSAPPISQSIVPTWTGIHTFSQTSASNTSKDGLVLTDTTAATSGNQQYSPRLRLSGQGWKTNSTAASQQVDWFMENRPVQGAITPSSILAWMAQANGSGIFDKMTLTSAGILALINQIDISSATAGQIKFPNSQNASSNANTLDDYVETVSWTPVIGGTGGQSGQTYIFQNGRAIKIGSLVVVQADVYLSNKGTITGNAIISGLPYTCNATVGGSVGLVTFNLASATVSETGSIAEGTNYVNIRIKTAAATTNSLAQGSDIANNTEIIMTAMYTVTF